MLKQELEQLMQMMGDSINEKLILELSKLKKQLKKNNKKCKYKYKYKYKTTS